MNCPRLARLGAALAACAFLPACGSRTGPAVPAVPAVERGFEQKFDPETANPRPVLLPPPEAKEAEPYAVAAREAVIRRDADAIRAECQRAAGGDWERWQRDTAPYRAALKAKIDALKTLENPKGNSPEGRVEPLAGRDGFPLFEVDARKYLRCLYEPESLDGFRKDRPVLAAHRWLRERGIDLIFVPVPKMTEVYAEHFLDPCPPDGVIAPHVRKTLLELLDAGVEVVDGFPLYRSVRDADAEYLYNTADSHWTPRGMRIMAKEVADRIVRYKFGARARYGIPIVKTEFVPYGFPLAPGEDPRPGIGSQYGWSTLSYEQQQRAAKVQTTSMSHVTLLDGREPFSVESPVVIIGNSFVPYFNEQLAKETNLTINTRWRASTTTEDFGDFLREPELLRNCRVLVWISTEKHLTDYKPLPPPVAAYADAR
jgi:SGNH hydrolase-like domain, acetyltransferase AlgX